MSAAASLNWKKDLHFYFYLHPSRLSGALSFISEITEIRAMLKVCRLISTNSILLQCISHWRHRAATAWHPLNWALDLHALHGHRSEHSLCHGLIFSLIKFTLPVSSTPSCDEWLIWLWGALFPPVRLGHVCACLLAGQHLAKLCELWQCVSGRETCP